MNIEKYRKQQARKLMKKPATKFERIILDAQPYVPKGMTRAYRNTRYTVMVYDDHLTTKGTATCVMVQKHDDTPIQRHWYEMQKIKNEIFGEDTTAVEYYPAQSQLVDRHNIYWMWIFPNEDLPIPVLK